MVDEGREAAQAAAAMRARTDLWRWLAMVGVVAIHAAGRFEGKLSAGGSPLGDAGLAGLLSQAARFSVPLFVVLSGYGLGLSAAAARERGQGWRQRAGRFVRRRGLRVLLPYLAWSLLSLWYHGRLGDPGAVIEAVAKGRADYHLYFCSFILQAYLLWPLLGRLPGLGVGLLLGVQLLFSSPVHFWWPGRPGFPGWVLIHWAGYFALGAWLARRSSTGPTRTWLASGLVAVTGLGVCVEYFWCTTWMSEPSWFNHFFRWTVIAFSLACVLLWRNGPGGRLGAWSTRLARVGFTVYFLHPWLLRWLDGSFVSGAFALLFPLSVVLSFGAGLLLDRLVRGTWPRALLGLG